MKHLLWKLLLLTLVSPAFSQTEPKDADSSPFNGIRVLGSDESKPTELGGTLRVGIYGAPGTTFLSEYNNSPDTALGKVSLFLNGIQMEKLRPVVLGPETDWDQMLNSEIRAADEKVKRDTIEGVAKDADQKAFKAKADAKTKFDLINENKDASEKVKQEARQEKEEAEKAADKMAVAEKDKVAAAFKASFSASPVLVLQYRLERDSNDKDSRTNWDLLLRSLTFGPQSVQVGIGLGKDLPHMARKSEFYFQVRPPWVITCVIILGLLLLFMIMAFAVKKGMLLEDGESTPYSLGKSQMAFWGTLVVLCFQGVFLVSFKMERLPTQVLVLLGTYDEQNALYDQGRGTSGKVVTNARGGYSNHNFGIAFDIGVWEGGKYVDDSPKYKAVGALGMELGLDWGGNWKSIQDEPHFQLRPDWAADLSEKDMLSELRARKSSGKDFYA